VSRWGERALSRIAHDYLTGPDGVTFAVGRGMGLAMFGVGLAFPVGVGVYSAVTLKPALSEWAGYLAALAAYWAGLAAAAGGLIWATNGTEPKELSPGEVKTTANITQTSVEAT
jgi:hypothetical protein